MSDNSEARAAIARLTRFLMEDDREAAGTFFAEEEAKREDPQLAPLESTLRRSLQEVVSRGAQAAEDRDHVTTIAARSDDASGSEPTRLAITIDGDHFFVSEDEDAVLHFLGPLPEGVTHLQLETEQYEVRLLSPTEFIVPTLTPALFEAFQEQALAKPDARVAWIRT